MGFAIIVDGTNTDFWHGGFAAYDDFVGAVARAAGYAARAELVASDDPLALIGFDDSDRIPWDEVPAIGRRLAEIIAMVDEPWQSKVAIAENACRQATRQHRSLYCEG